MKLNLSILLLLFINFAAAQPVVNRVFADTFIITKRDTTPAEFVLRNATKNVLGGVLTNLGNGRTAFVTPTQGTVINGIGFVKANGSSISYDNNSYVNLNGTYANPTWITSLAYSKLTGTPTIPAAQVNSDWNASTGLAQILNKPTIPAAQVNSDWNATTGLAQILNKPTIPAAQVNSDWNATTGLAQILNKPTIPSAANPTSTIGLTATNGTATTFMRSDAAPAINLGVSPVWTGFHTYSNSVNASAGIGRGFHINSTLNATANSDVLVGLDLTNTFSTGSFTNVGRLGIRTNANIFINADAALAIGVGTVFNTAGFPINNTVYANGYTYVGSGGNKSYQFRLSSNDATGLIASLLIGTGTSDKRFALDAGTSLLVGTTTSTTSAAIQIESTTRGFLPSRMTATQASAIASPAEGLLVYVTNTNATFTSKGWWGYNGATWEKLNN